MSLFNRVTIIGLGLIGGSLGLAIKEKRLAKKVTGVSRRRSTISKALAIGAVDAVTLDIKKGIKDADLVILTAPVLKIVDIAKPLSLALSPKGRRKGGGVIVTDAGSTKNVIVKSIESVMPRGVDFVGSHPMAGSERSGIQYADRDLFKEAYCILTKTPRTNLKALAKVKRFWGALGMKVVVMNPEGHDRAVSKLSHLPHAMSVALCNACEKADLRLAAGGFKDATRIASGDPGLWKDIFVTNRKNIARDIKVFKRELAKIEKALKNNNSTALLKILKKAKSIRDSI